MSPFVKLADPDAYVACIWDLRVDHPAREYWIPFFKCHLETILKLGIEARTARGESEPDVLADADACRREFHDVFDAFARNPRHHRRVTILTLDQWRDRTLRNHGFLDPFADLKHRENQAALPLLPRVLAELDTHAPGFDQIDAVVRGVFAGNIFDMGASATAANILEGRIDFFSTRDNLPTRPWLVDDFDALLNVLTNRVHHKAVYFIDNAGSDFLLGAIPMMRWLARRGTSIVLAANEHPTLNDMTVHDVRAWWPRILHTEPSLRGLPIRIVSTGTAEPLIDLSSVSEELNAASEDADLVIIEGMGRAIESNLDARFTCDALNVGMIKDPMIARVHGGKLYDVVLRFRQPFDPRPGP